MSKPRIISCWCARLTSSSYIFDPHAFVQTEVNLQNRRPIEGWPLQFGQPYWHWKAIKAIKEKGQ